MPRKQPKSLARPYDAIEPPRNAEVVIGVVSLTVLVLLLGSLSGSPVWLLGLFVFLPGTASALCTVRQTEFVAAWTTLVVAVTVLVQNDDSGSWLDRILLMLLTLALGAASVYACHRRVQREHETLRLRSTAAAMQRHILRPLPMLTEEVLVDGVYEPVQEDRLVGGDIYDVVHSPWGTRVLIGDVQGKGLPAVGAAFAVIGAFREAAHREPTLTALADSSTPLSYGTTPMPRRPATTNGSSRHSSSTSTRTTRRRPSTAGTSCLSCCTTPPSALRPSNPASRSVSPNSPPNPRQSAGSASRAARHCC